jgi:UDP-N-acetylglucosamine 2-epimerase
MKVASIVGARPQFIKAAVVSRELRKQHQEVLIHTGQHYDDNMSQLFFRELDIPEPDYNLGVGSGPHGAQTGTMLVRIERVLRKEKPDWVLVYGDTNSTLAGALAAAKLHIPVAHVEAGLRSFNRRMPEELNRVVVDHVSDLLFAPTETAMKNLEREGLIERAHLVGDVMEEALHYYLPIARERSTILKRLQLDPKSYYLVTVHRAENTDSKQSLENILRALVQLDHPVVFPLHPRTRKMIERFGLGRFLNADGIRYLDPVGYLEMLVLEENALTILTDSGGVQKEAYWLGVPCVTLREETEWVETVETGWNVLAGVETKRILAAILKVSSNSQRDLQASVWQKNPVGTLISLLAEQRCVSTNRSSLSRARFSRM